MSERHPVVFGFDPEIERTFNRRRKAQRKIKQTQVAMGDNINNGDIPVVPAGAFIVDDKDRAIRQYAAPCFEELNSGIIRPDIQATQFELKPVMFQMLQTIGQFSGMPTEDPHLHLRVFMEISDSFKFQGVPEDALRLKLFPYSVRDRARTWLNSLPAGSVTTWNDLTEKFLSKYFPPNMNAKLWNEINSFQQQDDESLYDAWERFKELLRKCPHHGILHSIQMETFYNGLNAQTKMVVDASANGALLSKSYNQAYEILETIATNNYQWSSSRAQTGKKVAGIYDVDSITSMKAQLASMEHMLKNLSMGNNQSKEQSLSSQINQTKNVSCVFCGEAHTYDSCPSNPESVFYMGNQNKGGPYSNTYNQSWRQHPNFSWSNQGANFGTSNGNVKSNYPPGFSQQAPQSNSLENMLKEYIIKNEASRSQTEALVQSQAASLRNLENQVGQLTNELRNRPHGTLPSDTEKPKGDGNEHCKAMTLKSGKVLGNTVTDAKHDDSVEPSGNEEISDNKENENDKVSPPKSSFEKSNIQPQPPFPQRFQKQKHDVQFKKFLDVLKQLHINIPLVEALK
ncbi:uncharacterized protein LOC108212402 [Daucus carota subsp. sativus]|uniref:uncharacterized protein LOC108212402 n=1 Tax=Daucus carota subsp. sativus TaxID=79200 RepID=UPI003082DABB